MYEDNPFYYASKFDLELISFERSSGSYEFDTIAFGATKDGQIYTAWDSGCSCPTPFEDYEGTTREQVLAGLERVGSLEQAEAAFDSWNQNDGYNIYLGPDDRRELTEWVKKHLKD